MIGALVTARCAAGGYATSEWLAEKFAQYLESEWARPGSAVQHINEAFLKADAKILAPKSGFFGAMGERGLGGSKCGATAAVALVFQVCSAGCGGSARRVTVGVRASGAVMGQGGPSHGVSGLSQP